MRKKRLQLSVKEIIELFRKKMQCGQLKYGDKFPSINELMSEYKIGRLKIKKIRAVLESENFIETTPGKYGTTVKYKPPNMKDGE